MNPYQFFLKKINNSTQKPCKPVYMATDVRVALITKKKKLDRNGEEEMIWFIWFFRTSTIPSSTLRHLPKESEKKKRGEIQPGNPGRPKGRGRIGKLGFSPWPSPRSSSLSSKNPFFPLSLPSCRISHPPQKEPPALIPLPHSRVSLPFPQIESPHCRPSKQSPHPPGFKTALAIQQRARAAEAAG